MGIWILSKGSTLQQFDSFRVRKNTDGNFGTGKGYLLTGYRKDEGDTVLADEFPTLNEAKTALWNIFENLSEQKACTAHIPYFEKVKSAAPKYIAEVDSSPEIERIEAATSRFESAWSELQAAYIDFCGEAPRIASSTGNCRCTSCRRERINEAIRAPKLDTKGIYAELERILKMAGI